MDLINDSPIPIHIQCGVFIYHGDETDNINDIINNKQFQPNLVSDFIDINAADWNRLFHWKLRSQLPVGYLQCDLNQSEKLKQTLDKQLLTKIKQDQCQNENSFTNILNSYQCSKYFRLQSTNDISMWKVIEAKEVSNSQL